MNYQEAKNRFIQQWGALGSAWGINKTMAQIHAVLLLSPTPITADDIMEELSISRGNASMSLKGLIDWGIVTKEYIQGERKEFFVAEKDMYRMASQVAQERRKRELQPVLHTLTKMKELDKNSSTKSNIEEMNKLTHSMLDFAQKGDSFISKFISAEKNKFFKMIMKL